MLFDEAFCSATCSTEDCERHSSRAPRLSNVRVIFTNLAAQCPRYSAVVEEDDLGEFKRRIEE